MTCTYTIWSRERLLGQTNLEYVRCIALHRMGFFHPREDALPLVQRATEPQQLASEHWKLGRRKKRGDITAIAEAEQREASLLADMMEACSHEEGLELQLRGPDGAVIPTEDVNIRDTHLFREVSNVPGVEYDDPFDEEADLSEENMEAARELQEFMDSLEDDFSSEWSPEAEEFPRYQVQVRLIDEADVP